MSSAAIRQALLLGLAALPLMAAGERPATAEPYLRLGVGGDASAPASFSDQDCQAVQPPALFGCGAGNNGSPLGAAGGFGAGVVLDAGLGYRFNSWLRAEALLSYRPSYDYSGNANFVQVAGPQPVSANLSSLAGFGVGYVDLPKIDTVRPYIGAGIGVARNRISAVTYALPALGAGASTTIAGGTSSGLAWLLTAGLEIPLHPQLSLDLAYRYTDLGSVQTDSGTASIVRPNRMAALEIAGTQTALQTHGAILSLRYAFR